MKRALEAGVLVGFLWAIVQFGVSEGVYRLAMFLDDSGSGAPTEMLYDLSNVAAWPAGHVYDMVDENNVVSALRSAPTQEVQLEDGQVVSLAQLADDIEAGNDEDYEKMNQAYDLLDKQGIYPEVSMRMEYVIYGGVCLCWGLLAGLFTAIVVMQSGSHSHEQRDMGRY